MRCITPHWRRARAPKTAKHYLSSTKMLNTNRNWIIWWKVWKSFSKTEIFLLALEPGARWRQNPNSRQRQWNRLKFGTLNNYHMASKMLNLKIKESSVGIVRWRQLAPKLEKYRLSSIKLFQVNRYWIFQCEIKIHKFKIEFYRLARNRRQMAPKQKHTKLTIE